MVHKRTVVFLNVLLLAQILVISMRAATRLKIKSNFMETGQSIQVESVFQAVCLSAKSVLWLCGFSMSIGTV